MIRSSIQVGEEQLLTTRMMASKIWFGRHEPCVNCPEGLKVVKLCIFFVEDGPQEVTP
jgi:hypothetical protein